MFLAVVAYALLILKLDPEFTYRDGSHFLNDPNTYVRQVDCEQKQRDEDFITNHAHARGL